MKYIIVIIALAQCVACANKTSDNLNYPIETIQEVMIDLYVASEAIKDINEEVKDSLLEVYKSQIEQIHQVDFVKIETDILAVRTDPVFYSDIHGVINDTINSIEQKYRKIKSKDNSLKSKSNSKTKSRPISFDNVKKIEDN